MSLRERYEQACNTPSDIYLHLPHFVDTVRDLDATTVVELGTRWGTSTVAWLYALEGRGHLYSVDVDPAPAIGEHEHWTHIRGDDCSVDVIDQLPDSVDVVFIDTSHAYDHTLQELWLYTPLVRAGGRVLLHDTELESPEVGGQPPYPVKLAINEFCTANNLRWKNYPHCYGLGVIQL